tara:strand:+ start:26 stop:304 length:279 start_codon:yes stop_codon:yes gene_type:complete
MPSETTYTITPRTPIDVKLRIANKLIEEVRDALVARGPVSVTCDRCGQEIDEDEVHQLATEEDEWDEVCADCVEDRPAKDMTTEEILTRRRL